MTERQLQYRTAARDIGDLTPDYGMWTNDEEAAREQVETTERTADPSYDEVWLERRSVVYGEPERVE